MHTTCRPSLSGAKSGIKKTAGVSGNGERRMSSSARDYQQSLYDSSKEIQLANQTFNAQPDPFGRSTTITTPIKNSNAVHYYPQHPMLELGPLWDANAKKA